MDPIQVPNTPNLEPETTPVLPLAKPKRLSPLVPMLLGVVVVVLISSVLAGVYYFARLKKEVASSLPTPTPTALPSPSLEPSPTTTPSATPKSSLKPTPKPTPTPTPTPSSTPQANLPTTDIRFGNPAAHIKQTYDDGTATGRVINREFSSIQVGEFDEIKSAWSPRVTVCFHVVSNTELEGSKLGYTMTEDGKIVSEGTLSQYAKIEAGKIYDVCHDTTTAIGLHKLELNINNTKSIAESSYINNIARLDFRNLADNIAPNFTLIGPNNEGSEGTCLFPQYISDNVSLVSQLKIEQKIDSNDWVSFTGTRYCFKGEAGTDHTYAVRIKDERGNASEQSLKFKLY